VELPAYYTLDLQAGVMRDGLRLQVFAKNVTDRRGINSLSSNTGGLDPDWVAGVIQPRTVGVSVSKTF
jgi:outer membrane receptor protein involved in Fe transport